MNCRWKSRACLYGEKGFYDVHSILICCRSASKSLDGPGAHLHHLVEIVVPPTGGSRVLEIPGTYLIRDS